MLKCCRKFNLNLIKFTGDSGGGFFVKHGRFWYIRGIVSSSLLTFDGACDITKHSVYTNVFDYTEWIVNKTGIRNTNDANVSPISIITRSMWSAAPAGPKVLYLNPPSSRIMISHTVTEECENRHECVQMMQNLQRNNQRDPPGFNDIYCNFLIGGDGLILEGRGWSVRGEHTIGATRSHNDAICVAFIGNYQDHRPKQSQIDAFFKLLDYGVAIGMLQRDYVINAQRDFHSSLSPGDAFYGLIRTWERFRKNI